MPAKDQDHVANRSYVGSQETRCLRPIWSGRLISYQENLQLKMASDNKDFFHVDLSLKERVLIFYAEAFSVLLDEDCVTFQRVKYVRYRIIHGLRVNMEFLFECLP